MERTSATQSKRRTQASKLLSNVAHRFQNPQLATLALRACLDAFTRVKKAIDEMIAQLLKEKEDEVKHKDFCVDGFLANASDPHSRCCCVTAARDAEARHRQQV